MINLKGKVAVITGSSRGIGKSIAVELAKQGAYIVLNGRNQSRLESAKLELGRFTIILSAIVAMFQKLIKQMNLLKQPYNILEN